MVQNQIANGADQSPPRLVPRRIALHRRFCACDVPAGGVGINLAIQDAVATANLLAEKLRTGPVSVRDLRKVQARREWPTRLIQTMQVFIHRRVVTGQTSDRKESLPFVFRLLKWFPVLRQIPARFIGIGLRPEHYCNRGR